MTGTTERADILDLMSELKATGETFALATVVRTVAATAAKAGAKAVIRHDGTITQGWIGGGCARGAVLKAAREAMADGTPRLVSIQPEDLLSETGISPGETRAGVSFARNMCPSKGTMDVFVEPVLPAPELVVCGASPVARAVADLAPRFGFAVTVCAPAEDQPAFAAPARRSEGPVPEPKGAPGRCIVVSTQGKGDAAALRGALESDAGYVAFVGSHAKTRSLRARLVAEGVEEGRFEALHAPAGLNIGAITPEEIALSILAEVIGHRRLGQRREKD